MNRRRMVVALALMGVSLVSAPAWLARRALAPIYGTDAAAPETSRPSHPVPAGAKPPAVRADLVVAVDPIVSTDQQTRGAMHGPHSADQPRRASRRAADGDVGGILAEHGPGGASALDAPEMSRLGSDNRATPAFNQPSQVPGGVASTWPPAGAG